MCGLAGVAGNTNVKVRDAFLDLLLVTQLRGRDATGVFTVKADNSTHYAKEVGVPEYLFDKKSFDQALHGVPKVMAGHCRAKTVGDNTRANAHPYDFDNVIGMHNGTLRGHHNMEGYDYKRTDSHCLYSNIDRYGVEETVRKLDPDGAYALVFWDKVNNRINFLRNEKRPLWFAWSKAKDAVFWCSEPWMFSAVARHIELWDGTEEGKEPKSPYFQLPVDQLWSFTVNYSVKPGEHYLKWHQPVEVKAEGRKSVGFSTPSSNTYSRGGEVANPFAEASEKAYERFVTRRQANPNDKNLDDSVDDIAQGGVTTSTATPDKSVKTSSNVLDFRRGLQHGMNSEKKIISLPAMNSTGSQRSNSGSGTAGCVQQSQKESTPESQFKRASVRVVAGMPHITHQFTSNEISEQEFEARTGGKCSFCKTPIGDLSEVAAFTDKAMSGFICNDCLVEPQPALVG